MWCSDTQQTVGLESLWISCYLDITVNASVSILSSKEVQCLNIEKMVRWNCSQLPLGSLRHMMGWPHYLQWRLRLLMSRRGPTVWTLVFLTGLVLFCLWRLVGYLHVSLSDYADEPGAQHITKLPSVVVVEEHHEVLKYWFEAVHQDLLPNHGLTLLHIDGHSDMASPQLLNEEGFPNFRMPRNVAEVKMLMQSNDVFIQGTMMAGVINRTIWVWPSWDHNNHETEYEMSVVDMGTMAIESNTGLTHAICTCLKDRESGKRKCVYEDRETSEEEQEIEESKCHIKNTFYFEEVQDVVAMKLLQQGNWLQPYKPLLLDIDEDFFGVEEAMKLFYEVGLSWAFIDSLDSELSVTFCPQTRQMEKDANRMMVQILKAIINCKLRREKCDQTQMQQNVQGIIMSSAIKSYFGQDHNQLFCAKYEYVAMRQLNKIMEAFIDLTPRQLKLLADIGFCHVTTRKTFSETEFEVCHGFTVPNETVVTLHTPTMEELQSQMTFLENFITHSAVPTPKLTTICRSIRDGYTPKRLFRKIEDGVLKITSQIYQDTKYDLLFDEDLLGGRAGWMGRHKT